LKTNKSLKHGKINGIKLSFFGLDVFSLEISEKQEQMQKH
jgi:hypothetical protein